ncbi:MAG: OmpH family outer membrane protein [Bacteroidales bacterium]|nr:OmpH family outer membrane protein [Bacteroidales bacterium]
MNEENTGVVKRAGNLSLILSIIALAGLAVLFVLFFTGNGGKNHAGQKNIPVAWESGPEGSLKVAFVNTDIILQNYLLVDKLSAELQSEEKNREKQLIARQRAYEKDAAYFQEQVSNNTISEASAQTIYEQLLQEQEGIVQMKDQYSSELAKKEFDMNTVLLDSISNYLKRLNQYYNCDYILSSNRGGSILFAKDTFDITPEVIEGLNEEYTARFPEETDQK